MALIREKASRRLTVWLFLAVPLGAEIRFDAVHDHLRKGCHGTLTVDEQGVSFAGPKKHAWNWKYEDIEQLELSSAHIRLKTYQDRKLRLGADREYEFRGTVPDDVYRLWKERLDRRFVAELADRETHALWSIPVKHLRRVSGSEGVLEIGADRIVYATDRKGEARTWRFADIENISSTDPYELTITTYERAKFHYGDRKGFNFQLKQPLSEARYNELWRSIETRNGRIQ